jgi:hypothetical protein
MLTDLRNATKLIRLFVDKLDREEDALVPDEKNKKDSVKK